MITRPHMYLLAPPNLPPSVQFPFELLSLWKLYGEREPPLNKFYFAKHVYLVGKDEH